MRGNSPAQRPSRHFGAVALGAALLAAPISALAVEGGTGAYLLGSRDSLAGIAPPPGTYLTNDFVHLDSDVSFLAIGGAALSDVDSRVFLSKTNLTHAFDATVLGGRPYVTVTVPFAIGDLDFSAATTGGTGLSGALSDSETGFGDLTITPALGWSEGLWHWSAAVSVFVPVGLYQTASVDLAEREVNALSFGKNRVAVDPTVALTWLDPDTGREATVAAGVTVSFENGATDYQTAPELHVEAALMQHLPSGLAVGASGYAYQQLDDDSGAGAGAIREATRQSSLRARVFGVGPLLTYSTKLGATPLSLKAKYVHEFGARKRFESEVFWATLGVTF